MSSVIETIETMGLRAMQRRLELHLSRDELAERAQLDVSHISRIERGERRYLEPMTILKLARGLEWTCEELIEGLPPGAQPSLATRPLVDRRLVDLHNNLVAIADLDSEELDLVSQQLAMRRAKLERAGSRNGKTKTRKRAQRNMQQEASEGGLPEVVGYSSSNKDAATFYHPDERVQQLIRDNVPPGTDPMPYVSIMEAAVKLSPAGQDSALRKIRKLIEDLHKAQVSQDNERGVEGREEHPA